MTASRPPSSVFFADAFPVRLARRDVQRLLEAAAQAASQRARFCAHGAVDDRLHEMIVALGKQTYVRPHRHPGKSESFHVLEGQADVVLFAEDGQIADVIRLEDYRSGGCFYFRMSDSTFHTVVVRSDMLLVHETTNGPFRRNETVAAPWAPDEADAAGAAQYMKSLREAVAARSAIPSGPSRDTS